ncbi:MAG TPA: helix-turn-helix transcriptional regulator [Aequorivita sp.]|nr:helix-turn-helix transcriptional regulator [Aequorivita sp.]
MVNSADFSKRLEKIMEFYEVNAAALAETIDFNRSTISHLLSGRNKPSLEFVMKVLQKFPEVDMDWLVSGKGNFPTTLSHPKVESEKVSLQKQKDIKEEPLDLFSNVSRIPKKNDSYESEKKEIERIVIFYTDGTFKRYEN